VASRYASNAEPDAELEMKRELERVASVQEVWKAVWGWRLNGFQRGVPTARKLEVRLVEVS